MLISPFETELYEKLKAFFSRYGFVLMADKKQFRKETSTGYQNVIFSVTQRGAETWLDVNFGLRHEWIEQAAQQFLDTSTEFRADANTLIISVGKFNNTRHFRYKILTDPRHGSLDLDDACGQIEEFMVISGFPFLNEHGSLEALYRLFNTHPQKPCKYLYNQIHRAFKGLITARFTNHDDFLMLASQYRNQLVRLGASFEELHQYERLLSYLLYQSLN